MSDFVGQPEVFTFRERHFCSDHKLGETACISNTVDPFNDQLTMGERSLSKYCLRISGRSRLMRVSYSGRSPQEGFDSSGTRGESEIIVEINDSGAEVQRKPNMNSSVGSCSENDCRDRETSTNNRSPATSKPQKTLTVLGKCLRRVPSNVFDAE